jgi:hypothetical protein
VISAKQALLLLVLAAAIACASAGEPKVFHEADLEALVDQPIPPGAELVGEFLFLGEPRKGFFTFTSFTATSGKLEFGSLLLVVEFPDGLPPGLKIGRAIKPDIDHPLFLQSVCRSPDRLFLIVRANSEEKL